MYCKLVVDALSYFKVTGLIVSPVGVEFGSGCLIDEAPNLQVVFSTDAVEGKHLPDFWNCGIPVMSNKLTGLLERAGVDNVQRIPALVKSESDGTIWNSYYAVNILGVISCANLENSEYTELPSGDLIFSKLVIDAGKAGGALLFRLQENPRIIIMHRSVARYIYDSDPGGLISGWDIA